MKLRFAWIGRTKEPAIQSLTDEFSKRIARYDSADFQELPSADSLLKLVEKSATKPFLVLLDSKGKQFSSEELARFMDGHQNRGTQSLMFAIGPADGFQEEMLSKADLVWSFGPMTLAHELARVVMLEQVYRAYTILKGHPYHSGH